MGSAVAADTATAMPTALKTLSRPLAERACPAQNCNLRRLPVLSLKTLPRVKRARSRPEANVHEDLVTREGFYSSSRGLNATVRGDTTRRIDQALETQDTDAAVNSSRRHHGVEDRPWHERAVSELPFRCDPCARRHWLTVVKA